MVTFITFSFVEKPMHFGVVTESSPLEHRVALAPYGVEELVANGHTVTVERGAGGKAQFSDEDYEKCGAKIAYSSDEAWIRPDVLLRFCPPTADEVGRMREGQVFATYVEMPFIPQSTIHRYNDAKITLLAFEEVIDDRGRWPLLAPLSIICGRMVPQIAARYLETFEGGRGKLIMGAPGVAPCNVSIIGAGMVGSTAAQMFQAQGARVTVLDHDHAQLERVERTRVGHLATLDASPGNVSRVCIGSDVLILAIHSHTGVCEKVIHEQHLKKMQPRSLIMDIAITQGGACETSRPTDVSNPTFVVENIVHYCVTRISATVSRTASRAVSSALVPYLLKFAEHTVEQAIAEHREFDSGLVCVNGKMRRKYDYIQ
jgi:alanine dehydrogenase